MKLFLYGAVIIVVLVVLFFVFSPFDLNLFAEPEPLEDEGLEFTVTFIPESGLSIIQGGSDKALTVLNDMAIPVVFELSVTHGFISLEPRSDTLAPGATRDIFIQVDNLCPQGKKELMLYYTLEAKGKSTTIETFNLPLHVTPGELKLEFADNTISVTWNSSPAPPQTNVYHRLPGTEEWQWRLWGAVPDLEPPSYLFRGAHWLEFMAMLGETESEVETFEIIIEY